MSNIEISKKVREILAEAEMAELCLQDNGNNFAQVDKIKAQCRSLLKELDGTYRRK